MLVRVQYRLAGLPVQTVDVSAKSLWAAADQVVRGISGGELFGRGEPPVLDLLHAEQIKDPENTDRLFARTAPDAPKGA